MRTVTIDGIVVDIQTEIIEVKSRDDSLETTKIVVKNSTLLEPYDVGLEVTILEDGVTEYFYIAEDTPVLTQRSPKLYSHTISLIEPYKIFERDTMPSLQYTQPLDGIKYRLLDVVDRALKLRRLEQTTDLGGERVYDIDGVGTRDANDDYVVGNLSGLALELYERKAPEMKFNTPYLSEICNEVFLLLDGRPYLKDFTTIGIKYFNEKNDEIDINDVDEITGYQNIEKFAQKYDVYMENAISESNLNKQALIYPSMSSWASVRSGDTELTTDNFLMQVPKDIERVLKWEVLALIDIEWTETNGITSNTISDPSLEIEVDMTDYLFTKRAWDGLNYSFDLDDSTGSQKTLWNTPYKNNAMYFDSDQIRGWHEDLDIWTLFGSTDQWNVFLGLAANVGGYLVPPTPGYWVGGVKIGLNKTKFAATSNVREFMFRLTYVPKQTVRVQIEKDTKGAVGTLFANQSDRIVDVELLGSNMLNQLNREGEKELHFTKNVPYADRFKLGDYYGEYQVTKVTNNRKTEYTLSSATLSKNYSRRDERIALRNLPRQTEISAENTIRNDIYAEYLEASTVANTNDSRLTLIGTTQFADTFRGANRYYTPVEFVLWETDIVYPVTSQGVEKMLSFNFSFNSNVVAGVKTELLDTIYANEFVRYTDEVGVKDTVSLKYYSELVPTPNTFSQKAKVSQELPNYDSGDATLQLMSIDLGDLNILKDSGEVYGLSYQLKITSEDSDIYIGNKLASENGLVVAETEQLYLYSRVQPIPFGERIIDGLTSQKMVTGTPIAGEVKVVTSLGQTTASVEFTTNFNNLYWAIGNANRDTYMIVNKLVEPKIYFNPRNKRSD